MIDLTRGGQDTLASQILEEKKVLNRMEDIFEQQKNPQEHRRFLNVSFSTFLTNESHVKFVSLFCSFNSHVLMTHHLD